MNKMHKNPALPGKMQELHSVNVAELDEHHQELADLTRKLARAKTPAAISKAFRQLKKYTLVHFEAEERLFHELNYPSKAKHIRAHKQFAQKLAAYEERFKTGTFNLQKFIEFLNEWWIYHVNHADQQYADFFNSRGVF